MDKEIRKGVVVIPRGHAKTSLWGNVFPSHHLAECLSSNQRAFILLVAKTAGHSERNLEWIKNLLEYSKTFRGLFGYHGSQNARTWTNQMIVLDTGDAIMARGTGQMVRGVKIGNQRPTFILLDDPEDENNTKTAEAMEANLRWHLQGLTPARDAQRGRVFVIGTPQHERCLVETLGDMADWKSIRYQALPDWVINDKELCDKILSGEVEVKPEMSLWHDMWNARALLQEMRSLQDIGRVSSFYREYQCVVVGDEDQLFSELDLRYYDGEVEWDAEGNAYLNITELDDEKLVRPVSVPINIFSGIDPASSTAQTADFSTIVNSSIDAKDRRFVLSYIRKRVKPMDLAQRILDNFKHIKAQKTQIETVGYQEMLRDYLRRQDVYIPGLEIKNNPRSQKSYRLETMQPWFAGRKVYIKRNMRELQNELLLYPRGKHDDLLDGLYYSFKGMYKPWHREKVVGEQRQLSPHHKKKSWRTA